MKLKENIMSQYFTLLSPSKQGQSLRDDLKNDTNKLDRTKTFLESRHYHTEVLFCALLQTKKLNDSIEKELISINRLYLRRGSLTKDLRDRRQNLYNILYDKD